VEIPAKLWFQEDETDDIISETHNRVYGTLGGHPGQKIKEPKEYITMQLRNGKLNMNHFKTIQSLPILSNVTS